MSDLQQEYADALAGYRAALARLQEAKRHIPQSPKDRWRQREREKREAERALDAQSNELTNRIVARSLALLHQKVNGSLQSSEETGTKIGESIRIHIIPPHDE